MSFRTARQTVRQSGEALRNIDQPLSRSATSSIELEPLALIARLAALVPPPRRHVVRYSGVLSSHSSLRSQIVPSAPVTAPEKEEDKPSRPLSHYISWSELLRRTFERSCRLPTECGDKGPTSAPRQICSEEARARRGPKCAATRAISSKVRDAAANTHRIRPRHAYRIPNHAPP